MSQDEQNPSEDIIPADRRRAVLRDDNAAAPLEDQTRDEVTTDVLEPRRSRPGRWLKVTGIVLIVLVVLAVCGVLFARHFYRDAMNDNLPKLDGSQVAYGLAAPVTVTRDARGVPHIRANSLDDLIFAQGFVTTQDRLWQMELMRRHGAGELAAILGRKVLEHDRVQRTLQLRAAADRAFAALPQDQKHWLEVYARGVNASMIAQSSHLPIEFRILGFKPLPWSPRDSVLLELVMFQDLTTSFPTKIGREALAAHLPPELVADLYPVGSWRDHPPGQPTPDLTAPQPEFKDVPLDESQTKLRLPNKVPAPLPDMTSLEQTLAFFHGTCSACVAGSNAWVVAGTRTASGKPMLSNDMHLNLGVPGLWYEADLQAASPAPLAAFHAAGVTLPGTPFVIVGHNDHVAWGFTNLMADLQDLYIEHTRGTPSGAEYQAQNGIWRAVRYQREVIHVRGGADVVLDVPLTHHGNSDTPIISSLSPGEARSVSLQWTIYDPANISTPFYGINSAGDGTSLLSAFSNWGGPPQNLMYADDQGHIGFHVVGRIPIRGDVNNPSPLSPVPTDAVAPDAATHEWVGYIPFEQLPQVIDPADGVLATANARSTSDGYRYPITLNWMAPYRIERIYKVLEASPGGPGKVAQNASGSDTTTGQTLAPIHQLAPADMLTLQNDVYSELDQVIAQRLAYSIDHASAPLKNDKMLRQAADILRNWNGSVDTNSAAPVIVGAARDTLWPMLLIPKLAPQFATQLAQEADLSKLKNIAPDEARVASLWKQYSWGERGFVEEELLTHTPARWLPAGFATWEDFLATVVQRGLRDAKAPSNLSTWQLGKVHPLDLEHPIFSQSPVLKLLIGVPTGTGPQPQSGDGTTVKQVGALFGPSERFTADLSDLDRSTLNIVLGQSGNPASAWYMDQFQDWLHGRTYPMPFSPAASQAATTHTLTLTPR